jgi:hypothetical protein
LDSWKGVCVCVCVCFSWLQLSSLSFWSSGILLLILEVMPYVCIISYSRIFLLVSPVSSVISEVYSLQ